MRMLKQNLILTISPDIETVVFEMNGKIHQLSMGTEIVVRKGDRFKFSRADRLAIESRSLHAEFDYCVI